MSDSRIGALAAALLLAGCCLRAQTDPSVPSAPPVDPLPKPGCDSYSMQTLPHEAFGFQQRACYWSSQLFTGSAFFGAALFGAVSEWRHKPPEWQQGFTGFGQQFGSRYVQGMVKEHGDLRDRRHRARRPASPAAADASTPIR